MPAAIGSRRPRVGETKVRQAGQRRRRKPARQPMEPGRRREVIEDPKRVGRPLERFFGCDHERLSLRRAAFALLPDDAPNRVISRAGEPELLGVASNAAPDLGDRESPVVVCPGADAKKLVDARREAHASECRAPTVTRRCRLANDFAQARRARSAAVDRDAPPLEPARRACVESTQTMFGGLLLGRAENSLGAQVGWPQRGEGVGDLERLTREGELLGRSSPGTTRVAPAARRPQRPAAEQDTL